jgi:NAD(P)-dependent dehydrogenase (short-subunit alcohol dehydrogenase family)
MARASSFSEPGAFQGRTAVVTGAGSGIGRGIALALAGEGMNVAVLDIQTANAEAAAHEIEASGVKAIALGCDVTSEDALADAARAATAAFGGVHVLSNNAGVIIPPGPIEGTCQADWDFVFSVNLFGIIKSVRAFLPALRSHDEGGHIVNTASMAGLVSIPDLQVSVYGASKYACVAYSEYLRAELAPEGIGVSVLCPGMVESNLSSTSAANRPAALGSQAAPDSPGPRRENAPPGAHVISGEECGRIVVGGIRDNRLHIVTHPESLPLLERRFAQLRADCAAETAAQRERG